MYPISVQLGDHTKHIVSLLNAEDYAKALKKSAAEAKKKSFYLQGITYNTDEIKTGKYTVKYEDNDEYIQFHQLTFNQLKKENE